jgi:hypothetical protein
MYGVALSFSLLPAPIVKVRWTGKEEGTNGRDEEGAITMDEQVATMSGEQHIDMETQ